MTILLTGGGSGGHITPLLAVARELKKKSPSSKLHYVGEARSRFAHLMDEDKEIFQKTSYIFAGKLRRYHGQSWLGRVLDMQTILLNLRDILFIFIGFCQSVYIMLFQRPDIVFVKGGYVGMPVGMAARLLGVPYITHDSDAIAGLTNRVIGKGAKLNAVGMPSGFYPYKKDKIVVVGIPVSERFTKFSAEKIQETKRMLSLGENSKTLLITGGSNGARRLNESLVKVVPDLLARDHDLIVVHQLGRGNMEQYAGFNHPRLIKKEFITELERYSGIANVIVSRAGANTIAEYSNQRKACVFVPNPYLAGGHQLKNADIIKAAKAGVVLSEKQILSQSKLKEVITELLEDKNRRTQLGENLYKLMTRGGSKRLAELIIDSCEK